MWLCGLRRKKKSYSSVSYSSYEHASPSQATTSTSGFLVGSRETEKLSDSLSQADKYGTSGSVEVVDRSDTTNNGHGGSLDHMSTPTDDHLKALTSGTGDAFKSVTVGTSIKDGAKRVLGEDFLDVLVFDAARTVLFSNVPNLDEGELPAIASVFADRSKAMLKGITLKGQRYEVHRYHPPLVYGRTATKSEKDSVGVALCKTSTANGEMTVFALVTYRMPALSARMVPRLQRFCKEIVEPLQQWWFIN